ncbi:MAG: inner membrane protein [Alphaproteobacteria bacterium]|jgi:inner membrane protein
MQFLISICFGMLCAWALKSHTSPSGLGYWRLVAGALAGAFPHLDVVLNLFGSNVALGYSGSIFWSLVLTPIYTNFIAFILAFVSGKDWKKFVPVTTGALLLTILLAMLTSKGIQPFAPFSHVNVALGLVFPFDLTIMGMSVLAISCGFLLPSWKRDIARLTLILVVGYVVVLGTFYIKAYSFAGNYAEAFSLEVENIHVIPQPISSFNWRLIIETKDQRYHDTMVNLFRKSEVSLNGEDSRISRIDSLYKPMDQAVWRVYRRYGHKNKAFSKSAWLSMYKSSDQFKWLSRFWVAQNVISYNGNTCARFVDLRREGSRRAQEAVFMICKENEGATLYRSDSRGRYALLEMIY